VGAAEQGVHVLAPRLATVGAQQDVFHLREQFAAFFKEGGQRQRKIHVVRS